MSKPIKETISIATVSSNYYVGAYQFALKMTNDKSMPTDWLKPHTPSTNKNRVAAIQYQKLLDAAAKELDEPCFGLKYGQQIDIATFSLLGYLAMASATLQDASKAVNQFGGLVSEIGQLQSEIISASKNEPSDQLVKIFWRPRASNESYSTQIIDGVLAGWANFGWQFIGEKAAIHSVHLTHRIGDKPMYESYFGCPVFFNSNENYICIQKRFFEKELCQAEPLVHKIIQERASQAIMEVENHHLLVSEYIAHLLPNLILAQQANIEHISCLLNTSSRSLQRKLSQEGTSFSLLLDQAKQAMAIILLNDKKHPISQISGMIGFNDQSSFTRAFKRWKDITPKQFQELN